MEMIWFALRHDWAILSPIFICSFLVIAVAAERWWFYRAHRRDVIVFIPKLQRELTRGLENGRMLSESTGGFLGDVTEEGIRILEEHRGNFERSFDITVALAVRSLERHLSILGTIATIAPYLGLFGTVIRILLTFGEMAKAGGGGAAASQVMFGIGSALIATACGLAVAMAAVALNNYFHSVVNRYEDDFQLVKLTLLGAIESSPALMKTAPSRNYSEPRGRI